MIDPDMLKALELAGPLEPPDWCRVQDTAPKPGRALVCTICHAGEVIELPITPRQLVARCNAFILRHQKCGRAN